MLAGTITTVMWTQRELGHLLFNWCPTNKSNLIVRSVPLSGLSRLGNNGMKLSSKRLLKLKHAQYKQVNEFQNVPDVLQNYKSGSTQLFGNVRPIRFTTQRPDHSIVSIK